MKSKRVILPTGGTILSYPVLPMPHGLMAIRGTRNFLPAISPDASAVDSASIQERKTGSAIELTGRMVLGDGEQSSVRSMSAVVYDASYSNIFWTFPLEYLRSIILMAYRWAQDLLWMNERMVRSVDIYV